MRPQVYTQAAAAARLGVSRRTIRSWCTKRDKTGSPWLAPLPGSITPLPGEAKSLGYPLYAEPDLVRAERLARDGRNRRWAHVHHP